MSTVGAFSGRVRAPLGWDAGAVKSETANVDRRPQQVFTLAFLLMWGMMALVLCAQAVHLRAATTAHVIAADGPYTSAYQYAYKVGDQTCTGTAYPERPLPERSTEITIHYDPDRICDSVSYDPGIWGFVMVPAWGGAAILFVIWVWPRKGPN